MRNYLDHFIPGYTILPRALQVMSQLFRTIQGNQGSDGHETAISLREPWPLPDIAEQHFVGYFSQLGIKITE